MTKKEIYEKYGDVKLKFNYYYKYSFCFHGKTKDGTEVYASVGGDSDEVYRIEITAGKEETIGSLEPDSIQIYEGGKKIIDWSQ